MKTKLGHHSLFWLLFLLVFGVIFYLNNSPSGALEESIWTQKQHRLLVSQNDNQLVIAVDGLRDYNQGSLYYSGPFRANVCRHSFVKRHKNFKSAEKNIIELEPNSGGKYYCLVFKVSNQVVVFEPFLVKNSLRNAPFKRGRLIDDDVFVNYRSMTVDNIQSFLEATVANGALGYGRCDRYGRMFGYRKKTPSYTCLFEYQYNPKTDQDNYGLFDEVGQPIKIAGGQSAAEIIYQAARDYKINPQVLLATLQKEQNLVFSAAPKKRQFKYAAGYACPDNQGCSQGANNFYFQVRGAAWSLRKYFYYLENGISFYKHKVGTQNIATYPDNRPECPSIKVNIENKATAALYIYTPYVYAPKAVRLAMGDHCTSNGNINFWGFFNTYFAPGISSKDLEPTKNSSQIRISHLGASDDLVGYYLKIAPKKGRGTVGLIEPLPSETGDCRGGVHYYSYTLYRAVEEILITPKNDQHYYCLALVVEGQLVAQQRIFIDWRLLGKRPLEFDRTNISFN